MPTYLFADSPAATSLSGNGGSITAAATSFNVSSSTGWPAAVTNGASFFAQISTGASAEIVLVTNVSGTTWTVTRGQDGTTAAIWADGTALYPAVEQTAMGNLVQIDSVIAQRAAIDNRLLASPGAHGYLAWTDTPRSHPAAMATVTTSTLYLARVEIPYNMVLTAVDIAILTLGATLTSASNYVGIYSSAGTKLWQSADQSTLWTSTGLKACLISGGTPTTLTLTGGPTVFVWVAFQSTGTTTAKPAAANMSVAAFANANLAAATARAASAGTTIMPASITPASNTLTANEHWAGLR